MLNQPFRKHARTGRPLVVFKSAMTLDGKVATRTGDSQWISGEASRARAHRWRAESDAVAVGIGTALVDDPRLTARIEGVARQPRRVVFDSEARLPLDSQLVKDVSDVPLIVVCARAAKRTSVEALQAAGVDVIVATGENEGARVQHALDELGAREIQSLLLEGGPHLAGAFLEAERDRRGAHVHRADPARRREGEDRRGGDRLRRDRRRAARRSPSRPSGSRTTCCSWPASRSGEVFTGLVAGKGVVRALRDGRLEIETPLAAELAPGDSIAVNGVCLTATERDNGSFAADVMPETLRRTSLAPLAEGDEVNLELPLRAGDRLGGHVMQGHVDGTGTVESVARGRLLARGPHPGRAGAAPLRRREGIDRGRRRVAYRFGCGRRGIRGVADPRDARADDARRGRARPHGEPRGRRPGQVRREAEGP